MEERKATRKKLNAKAEEQATRAANLLHLPDPKLLGPFRTFTSDPGWHECWWWLGLPLLYGLFVVISFQVSREGYENWVIPEGYGVIEVSQFFMALFGFFIAVTLLVKPFVRTRPFTFAVTLIAAVSCLYIAGEEMSWGQHIFHWNTPGYWELVNRQGETNFHNTYYVFDKLPRNILQLGVVIGGLIIPFAAALDPRLRARRLSLFLPAAALVPAAFCAMVFKFVGPELIKRPSETVESYLYFFMVAYLVVYARRIRELEADGHLPAAKS